MRVIVGAVGAVGGAVGSSSSVLAVNTGSFNARQCRCLGILNPSVLPDLTLVGTAGHSVGWWIGVDWLGVDWLGVVWRDEDDPQAFPNAIHASVKLDELWFSKMQGIEANRINPVNAFVDSGHGPEQVGDGGWAGNCDDIELRLSWRISEEQRGRKRRWKEGE